MRTIDFAKLPTEKTNPASKKIDRLPTEKVLDIMNAEDTKVPRAIRKVKGRIAQAVRLIIFSLNNGGRLFFAGAGTSGRLGPWTQSERMLSEVMAVGAIR